MTRQHYPYLIIGGGMTADSAARGIRELDPEGKIGILSAETNPPYNRPPLTKGLWKRLKFESIWRQTERLANVDLLLGRRVMQLDADRKIARDHLENEYSYDKLLLATGGTPNRLPFGGDEIIYYRYLPDYQQVRALAEEKQKFVVIGGGFIGSEIAAALAIHGKQVTMLFPEVGIGARLFSPAMVAFLNRYYEEHGVHLLHGQSISAVEIAESGKLVHTSSGEVLPADGIIAGLGIRPNVELARQAGLEIDNGIVVDASLRTSRPDIYAAGDVAAFFNPLLEKRIRVEHEENANESGLASGRAMAGASVSYDLLPMVYSDLFDLGYESVGEIDARLDMLEDWQEPYRKGAIYYLDQGRVRGVATWGTFGKMDQARALIAGKEPFGLQTAARRIQV